MILKRRRMLLVRLLVLAIVISLCVLYFLYTNTERSISNKASRKVARYVQLANKIHKPSMEAYDQRLLKMKESNAGAKHVRETTSDTDVVDEYCNSPFKEVKGNEGKAPYGYTLSLVHVFIRHGDRTALAELLGYQHTDYSCNFTDWLIKQDYKDSFAHSFSTFMDEMSQHITVDKSFRTHAFYPNKPSCRDSALTARGVLQHIHLGRHFRESYIVANNHLNISDSFNTRVFVKTTKRERTFQSANAFLYGFLPHSKSSYPKLHKASNMMFCESSPSLTCNCKQANGLYQRRKRLANAIATSSSTYADLAAAISKALDVDVEELPHLSSLADTLSPSYCHGMEPRCSRKDPNNCVSGRLVSELWDEMAKVNSLVQANLSSGSNKFASISAYPLLLELAQRISKLPHSPSRERFFLYSGHDLTLEPLLEALGVHSRRRPPYASRLVIEAYQSPIGNDVMVRILYNGNDVTESVSFCENDLKDGMCPSGVFYEFVSEKMLQRHGHATYNDACSVSLPDD